MKDALVIILYDHPKEHTADYCTQTSLFFEKENYVLDVLIKDSSSIKEILYGKKNIHIIRKVTNRRIAFTPLYLIPFKRIRIIENLNMQINMFCIRLLITVIEFFKKFSKKYLWVYSPDQTSIAYLFDQSYYLVYDCVDYHGDENNSASESMLIQRSNTIVVNSMSLYNIYKQKYPNALLSPSGFDLSTFEKNARAKKSTKSTNPIIGYIGGINSRLDFKLLEKIIRSNPDIRFTFIGPIQQRESTYIFQSLVLPKISKLLSTENVQYIPYMPREKIISYISQFSISIIPYDSSLPFNRYSFPMKIIEYFYMGIPVLSTPIDEIKRMSQFVSIGNTPAKWNFYIRKLLKKPQSLYLKKRKRVYAIQQSWDKKFNYIMHSIEPNNIILDRK